MGLDMYLYLRKHESVGRWDDDFVEKSKGFYPEEFREFEDEIREHNFLSKDTVCQIGYWRKANAIHNWFVENCADGEDNCQTIYVSKDKAKELLDICNAVLEDHSKASELLHTKAGFFFGGTEYDDWYFDDLKYTASILSRAIKFLDAQSKALDCQYSLQYEASW